MLIIFTVNDQKISYEERYCTIVGGSSGEVLAAFTFDKSWANYETVVVFSNSAQPRKTLKPLRYEGDPVAIPEEALVAGKLYVSVIGFSLKGKRRTTQKWDIQQAITVQEFGELGDMEILRDLAHSGDKLVEDEDIADNSAVADMLDRVFGKQESDLDEGGEADGEEEESVIPSIPETAVVTNKDVEDMLDRIFGSDTSE